MSSYKVYVAILFNFFTKFTELIHSNWRSQSVKHCVLESIYFKAILSCYIMLYPSGILSSLCGRYSLYIYILQVILVEFYYYRTSKGWFEDVGPIIFNWNIQIERSTKITFGKKIDFTNRMKWKKILISNGIPQNIG